MAEQFSHGDADASSTYPTQCSSLRRGGHVMLKGHPCKIVEMLTSVPGKHGHAKASSYLAMPYGAWSNFQGTKFCPQQVLLGVDVDHLEYVWFIV